MRLIRIFSAAKIPIMEGYGLTKPPCGGAANRYEESGRRFGSVGPLIGGVEVKIAEDEILCRDRISAIGYYKRPDLTAEVIDQDGWFIPVISAT